MPGDLQNGVENDSIDLKNHASDEGINEAFILAAGKGYEDIVKNLLENAEINYRSLHHNFYDGIPHTGTGVQKRDTFGSTALIEAIKNQRFTIVKILIAHGVDPLVRDIDDIPPFDHLNGVNHGITVMEDLLIAGVNIYTINSKSSNPQPFYGTQFLVKYCEKFSTYRKQLKILGDKHDEQGIENIFKKFIKEVEADNKEKYLKTIFISSGAVFWAIEDNNLLLLKYLKHLGYIDKSAYFNGKNLEYYAAQLIKDIEQEDKKFPEENENPSLLKSLKSFVKELFSFKEQEANELFYLQDNELEKERESKKQLYDLAMEITRTPQDRLKRILIKEAKEEEEPESDRPAKSLHHKIVSQMDKKAKENKEKLKIP